MPGGTNPVLDVCIAVAQMDCTYDPDQNARRAAEAIREACRRHPGCHLVVLPELAASGYSCGNLLPAVASAPGEGPVGEAVKEAARSHGVYIAYGYPEQGPVTGIFYDSAALVSPSGRVVTNYRKVHVLPREAQHFAAGDRFVVGETALGRIGLLICWDVAFPEAARACAMRGAEILLVLAAWEKPYGPQWQLSVRARALDNGVFVAGCNRSGVEGDTEFAGHSLVCDPLGNVLAEVAGDSPGIAAATLPADQLVRARLEFATQIRELRPAAYGAVEVVRE